MKCSTREEALELARGALRRTLEPLGPAAQAAVESPEYAPTVRAYIESAWTLSDAMHRFDGTEDTAGKLEQAAAGYRAALATARELVAQVALRFVMPAGGRQ